jgi:hypothetical protein
LIAGTVDATGTGKTDSRKIPDATMLRDHGVDVAESAVRGALRILGTCVGAGLAVALTPLAFSDLAGQILASTTAGGAALYPGLTAKRANA